MSVVDKMKEELIDKLYNIEHATELTKEQKISRIQHATCAVCAGVAVQPIPFADIFILTPIQAIGAVKIAHIHGMKLSESEATTVLKELGGLVGMGVAAQQFAIGLYKTILPFFGAVTTIPLVYGLTYAIMAVVDYYFESKQKDSFDAEKAREIFKSARKRGEREGKDFKPGQDR